MLMLLKMQGHTWFFTTHETQQEISQHSVLPLPLSWTPKFFLDIDKNPT